MSRRNFSTEKRCSVSRFAVSMFISITPVWATPARLINSSLLVLSPPVAALLYWYSHRPWLLPPTGTLAVNWLLRIRGSLLAYGCSPGVALSFILATPLLWHSRRPWLLVFNGSLITLGYTTTVCIVCVIDVGGDVNKKLQKIFWEWAGGGNSKYNSPRSEKIVPGWGLT